MAVYYHRICKIPKSHTESQNDKTKTKVQLGYSAYDGTQARSCLTIFTRTFTRSKHNVIPTILLNTAITSLMSETEGQNTRLLWKVAQGILMQTIILLSNAD